MDVDLKIISLKFNTFKKQYYNNDITREELIKKLKRLKKELRSLDDKIYNYNSDYFSDYTLN